MRAEHQRQTKKQIREMRREKKQQAQTNMIQEQKLTKNIWLGLILVIILSLSGWTLISKIRNNNIKISPHTKGNPEASISLVEYSDLQCPACAMYASSVNELIKIYPNDINITYKHFPLRSIHPKAQLAAQASEAAGLQNKFWEMHDLLFEQQSKWTGQDQDETTVFVGFAGELGLNTDQFIKDLNLSAIREKVNNDYFEAIDKNLNATPSFFLNGEKLENVTPSLEAFEKIILPLINKES